jgi:hypothetical protein
MDTIKKWSFVLILLTAFVFSVSCKKQAAVFSNVENADELARNDTEELPDDIEIDNEIDVTLLNCQDATLNGAIQTFTTQVYFPSAIECEFNEQGNNASELNSLGNGPRENQKIRARIEQSDIIVLPTLGKICDVDFSFPTQNMEYDDEIFLTLNNFVLMASTNYATNSGSNHYTNGLAVDSRGLQTYKWSGENSLYNLYYAPEVTPRYCHGLDSTSINYQEKCLLPATQTLGTIKLDIPKEKIVELAVVSDLMGQSSNQATALNFGFISTGDNDNGDCEHSAFNFQIDVKYYVPAP